MKRGPGSLYRKLESIRFLLTRDRREVLRFLACEIDLSLEDRLRLLAAWIETTNAVRGYHTLEEILRVCGAILARPSATVVEAGAGKGASTAKLSLAVRAVGGRLFVFDSFRGIPENDEVHESIHGKRLVFRAGAFTGRLEAVRRVVERFGAPEVCTFTKGWFEDTLPSFSERIDVALLDVDLERSTRTCLEHLFPKVAAGGVLFTQDGHLRAIIRLLEDPAFWSGLGVPRPSIPELGRAKLLEVRPGRGHTPRP